MMSTPSQPPRRLSIYDRMQFDYQLFSLPFSTMNHLIENANAESMKKLQETCKYFYFKRQIFIVEKLFVNDVTKSLSIKWQDLTLMKSKLWLHNQLLLRCKLSANLLIPKIFKCELSSLIIREDVQLTFSDLKFLTNSGTIKRLSLFGKVYDSEDNLIPVPVHRILSLVPTVIYLDIQSVIVEQKAMEKFLKEERAVKFQRFELFDINQWLDPNLVLEFVKKNLSDNPSLFLKFETDVMNRAFRNAVDPEIRSILHGDALQMFFMGME